MEFETLTGPEKAAIVILSLPQDAVNAFLSHLADDEVRKALAAVARMDEVPPRVQERVLEEFHNAAEQGDHTITGGRSRALEIIDTALQPERAKTILEDLGREEKRVDWTLRAYQPAFIGERIAAEHPQTIALILSQIPADRGGIVIQGLPEELRPEVVVRLANLDTVTTDVIADLEEGVAELFDRRPVPSTRVGGAAAAASALNRVPKDSGAAILEGVDVRDPEVAGAIRKRMLTFNDLETIDRRGFQSLLREVSTEDLAVALKACSDEMKQKVFSNLSSRAADQIREEIDLLGPMKLGDVERVQEQVVDIARRLEEEGRLSIEVGGSDEILV